MIKIDLRSKKVDESVDQDVNINDNDDDDSEEAEVVKISEPFQDDSPTMIINNRQIDIEEFTEVP